MPRLLMTADTVGGVWTYALELAAGLAARGVEIGLATMGAPLSGAQQRQAAAVPRLTVFESSYKLEWMPDPWTDLERAADWLLKLENDFSPDIVHLNGYAHGSLPWRAPHVVVAHSCVLSWWKAVHGAEAPPEWDRYRQVVRMGLQSAHRVIAPSHAMKDALSANYGPVGEVVVVPNGCSSGHFVPGSKEPFIFSAGRAWDEAKNIQVLGRIRSRIEWPVCVAGGVEDPQGGRRSISNVKLVGRLAPAAVASWMSRAAIYCLPALYEPFGLSVLEAALSGCALVLSGIASLRENWEGAAVLVDPRDEGALAAELSALISDEPRRRDLASRAARRALDFTAARMVSAYVEIYEKLAGVRCELPSSIIR